MRLFISILIFLSFTLKAADFKLNSTESLPQLGIKIKVPKKANAIPFFPLIPDKFYGKRNGVRITVEMYNPYEFWRTLLAISQWRSDESGNVFLSELKITPPTIYKDKKFVPSEKIKEWQKSAQKPANREEALACASEFINVKLEKVPTAVIKKTPNLLVERLLHEAIYDEGNISTFYLISCKNANNFSYFIINYQRLDFDDVKKNNAALAETNAAAATFEYRPQNKKNLITESQVKRSKEYLLKRDEVINQVKALPDWTFQELDSYIIMTNSKNKRMVKMVEEELDRCNSVFQQYFPYNSNSESVARVKIFAKREQYEAYVPEGSENSGGLFMPSTQELLVAPIGEKNNRVTAKRMMSVLYHEAFHHFAFLNGNGHQMPTWFNEGCARFFENIEFKQNTAVVAVESCKFERWTNSVPKKEINCKRLLLEIREMSQSGFYAINPTRNYNFSGMVIYFIQKSPAFLPKMKYDKIATDFFKAVRNGDPSPNETAWKDVDLDLFCKNLIIFTKSKTWQARAARYSPPQQSPK